MVCKIRELTGDDYELWFYRDDQVAVLKVKPPQSMSKEQLIAILVGRGWTIVSWADLVFELRDPQLERERSMLIEQLVGIEELEG